MSMEDLAKKFIEDTHYSPEDFEGVDVSNILEKDVNEWIENRKGLLMNYEDYEWEYKNRVYEWVCKLLEID